MINTINYKAISAPYFFQKFVLVCASLNNNIRKIYEQLNRQNMLKRTQIPEQGYGFTLIEILVVLLIIGIMLTSIAVKVFPDERQVLRQEADRLSLLLEQARDEAFISGRSIAWSAQNEGYIFWRLNLQRQWEPIATGHPLRARKLPPAMTVTSLSINQVKVPPGERLVFTPAGLNPSFAATLDLHEHRLRLSSDSLGQIKIQDE